MSQRNNCPNCPNLLVSPIGPTDAKILLIGDFPGYEDVRFGRPFSGVLGDVLRKELTRIGVQMAACRATNLWLHAKNEKTCKLDWHLDQLAKEIAPRKYVLVMGSDVSRALFGVGAMEVAGLEVPSTLFTKHRFVVGPNPAILSHSPIGEFRLALKTFERIIHAE